ncbi:HNH endonuclease signature motif containing protein [Xanthobacter sp. TB0136]|uniref:HNH endonuclease signature motif containing protein n=1 Tax=Xanthobacter sp. TB0136 TaxID=3459177 RepID=UPI0040396EE9
MKFPFEPRQPKPAPVTPLDRYLCTHPVCERCGAPSVLVDHVIPHHGDDGLIFMRENMRAVCRACHSLLQAGE